MDHPASSASSPAVPERELDSGRGGTGSLPLHVAPGEGLPFDHTVTSDIALIGRSSRADLAISDRSMSREHARLSRGGDGWVLEDLESRNGTFVNGIRISEPRRVGLGDTLAMGSSVITIRDQTTPAAEPLESPLDHTVFRSAAEVLRQAPESESALSRGDDPRRRAERLAILNEVHRALARSLALDDLLELILDRTFDHLAPEQGAIFLKGADGEYRCAASRSRHGSSPDLLSSRHLATEIAEKGLAALVLDTHTDDRFNQAMSIMYAGVRSLVAAPLLDERRSLGMIVLGSTLAVRQFTEEDMELLVSLASVAALRISNLALAEEAAERRRLEEEVALARGIQVALLPALLPKLEGFEVYGSNVPSRGASGDFYKIVERLQGQECVLMVADVSGKGIGAALLTASLEALSAGFLQQGLPPDEVCTQVSRLLFERTEPEKFATAFVAALVPATATLGFCNAGHNPALIVRADGRTEWLDATGMPLGIMADVTFSAGQVALAAGDIVILYTDGITEACNVAGEEYGEERLARACSLHRNVPLDELALALEHDLDEFVEGTPFVDDRTLVLVRRAGVLPTR